MPNSFSSGAISYSGMSFTEISDMFTQQHYIAVAEIIKGARVGARKVYDSRDGDLAFSEYDARMDQIAAVQLAFIRKFENDNPKFNKLLFIGACGESGMSQEV